MVRVHKDRELPKFYFIYLLISRLQKPNMGLGMILDSAVGMYPHKIGPLLQLLTALVSNKSTVKKVDLLALMLIRIQTQLGFV